MLLQGGHFGIYPPGVGAKPLTKDTEAWNADLDS